MGKYRFPRILACSVGLGLLVTLAIAGDAPRDHKLRTTWVVEPDSDEAAGRAFLGVSTEEETERAEGGARVIHVIPDSPAEEVGLIEGDVIVKIDGQAVYGPRGLTRQIRSHEPGQSVEVVIDRDGQTQGLSVELGERSRANRFFFSGGGHAWSGDETPERLEELGRDLRGLRVEAPLVMGLGGPGRRPRLGVQLVEATAELREHLGGQPDTGVLVGKVLKGMPAEMAGIRVGDLIVAVDGQTIEDAQGLVDAIHGNEGGPLRIDLVREGRATSVDVVLPDPSEHEGSRGPRA